MASKRAAQPKLRISHPFSSPGSADAAGGGLLFFSLWRTDRQWLHASVSMRRNQPAQAVQAEDSEVQKSPGLTPTSFIAPTHFNSLQDQQHCFMGPQNPPLFLITSETMLPWNQQETVILLATFKTSQFLSTGLSPYWSPKAQENLFRIKALGHMLFICVHGTPLILDCGTDTQNKTSV